MFEQLYIFSTYCILPGSLSKYNQKGISLAGLFGNNKNWFWSIYNLATCKIFGAHYAYSVINKSSHFTCYIECVSTCSLSELRPVRNCHLLRFPDYVHFRSAFFEL